MAAPNKGARRATSPSEPKVSPGVAATRPSGHGAAADDYWAKRVARDHRLAQRAAEEVAEQVRRAYRDQYLVVARRLDELYAEAQRRGELSRTKLWNYRAYRTMEADLREFCEVNVMHQRDAMYKLLDQVFEDTIGATVEQFQRDKFILPYSPRAVIDTAWSGDNFSSRIWKNTNQLAERIRVEARQVVMGLKSTGVIKQQLMRDYDVSMKQAERLIDTEVSYVLNKANLEGYRRMDVQKVTIINLDVNTCEKCKALEGQVFLIDDAPVIPIHPRCHCSYCVPREGDDAEVTASGADLDRVYADADVKGYERFPKDDGRKITFSMSEIRSAPDAVPGARALRTPEPMRKLPKTLPSVGDTGIKDEAVRNPAVSDVSGLRRLSESGVSEAKGRLTAEVADGTIKAEEPPKLMDEAAVRDWIISDACSKALRIGRQRVHIQGTKEYSDSVAKYARRDEFGPSLLSITEEEAHNLGLKYMGTGRIFIGKTGWDSKETIVNNEKPIGYVVNNLTGVSVLTTAFKIHYSRSGFHIVPDYPSKKKGGI